MNGEEREAEQREAERRLGDRRRTRRARSSNETWFGVDAVDTFPAPVDQSRPRFGQGSSGPGWQSTVHEAAGDDDGDDAAHTPSDDPFDSRLDSSLLHRAAAEAVVSGQSAFERIYKAFIAARAALGLTLVLALVVGSLFGLRPRLAMSLITAIYAALSIGVWLLPRFKKLRHLRKEQPSVGTAALSGRQWLMTIGVDLTCFMALHVFAPGSSFNFVALLVLPVLMAGVLTSRTSAMATAAGLTLALLGAAWLTIGGGVEGTAQMTQAALAGAGLLLITFLAGELAGRLAREEMSARGSLAIARQQAQLNRLVIEEMQDGVLVVDRHGRVRTANPAARRLLAPSGMCRPAPFQLRGVPAWDALVKTTERAFRDASWPESGRDVSLAFAGVTEEVTAFQRTVCARVRFTRQREPESSEELCVLFLEDVRNMQARSRQEKLAAMGRVSAGIAHEIRNPLAAISQANALLAEDATDPVQCQLMRMVTENVERLKRIVDDVMEVAPGATPEVGVIDAAAQVAAVCNEWAQAGGLRLDERCVLQIELPNEPLGVLFDAEHLRRVLVNLLDNARRHATNAPGAIQLRLESRHEAQAFLSLASDGPPIPPNVEPYLFEPFFSTRSRGTGLGLYICRELCARYGATIDYRVRVQGAEQRNEFFVDMRRQVIGSGAQA